MHSVIDHDPHGYTEDDDGNTWYWQITTDAPSAGDVTVRFRDHGHPADHPYNKHGHIPDVVRAAAKEYIAHTHHARLH